LDKLFVSPLFATMSHRQTTPILVFTLLALAHVCEADFNFNCSHLVDQYYFDLKPLARGDSDNDYKIEMSNGSTIYFNLCETLNYDFCKNDKDSMANIFFTDPSTHQSDCSSLTNASKWSNLAINWHVEKKDDKEKALIGTYPATETCTFDTSKLFEFKMNFICDHDHDDDIISAESTVSDDQCSYEVAMKSKYACPKFSFSRIAQFIKKYHIFFALGALILGLFECFYGRKLFKPTLFIFVTIFVTGFIFLVVYQYIVPAGSSHWVGWVVLSSALATGLGTAACLLCFLNIGLFVVGAFLGLCISFLLQNLFLYKIHAHPAELPFYITFAILGLTFGLLAIWIVDHIMIVATTLVGAYAAIRGISLFFPGTFPNEFTVASQMQSGEMKHIPWEFYLYFVCIMILFGLGMFYQYHHKHREEDDKEAENRYKVMSANSADDDI